VKPLLCELALSHNANAGADAFTGRVVCARDRNQARRRHRRMDRISARRCGAACDVQLFDPMLVGFRRDPVRECCPIAVPVMTPSRQSERVARTSNIRAAPNASWLRRPGRATRASLDATVTPSNAARADPTHCPPSSVVRTIVLSQDFLRLLGWKVAAMCTSAVDNFPAMCGGGRAFPTN
jgi:hypothetical protein